MTRKEKELKLLELFGLKVGDKILIKKPKYFSFSNEILQIVERTREEPLENYIGCLVYGEESPYTLNVLIVEDWQKVKPLLKDKKCKEIDCCNECPLKSHYCGDLFGGNLEEHTLGEVYNAIKKDLDVARLEIFGDEK